MLKTILLFNMNSVLYKSPSKNKAAIIWKFVHKLVSLQQKHILITYENDNVSLYSIRRV